MTTELPHPDLAELDSATPVRDYMLRLRKSRNGNPEEKDMIENTNVENTNTEKENTNVEFNTSVENTNNDEEEYQETFISGIKFESSKKDEPDVIVSNISDGTFVPKITTSYINRKHQQVKPDLPEEDVDEIIDYIFYEAGIDEIVRDEHLFVFVQIFGQRLRNQVKKFYQENDMEDMDQLEILDDTLLRECKDFIKHVVGYDPRARRYVKLMKFLSYDKDVANGIIPKTTRNYDDNEDQENEEDVQENEEENEQENDGERCLRYSIVAFSFAALFWAIAQSSDPSFSI